MSCARYGSGSMRLLRCRVQPNVIASTTCQYSIRQFVSRGDRGQPFLVGLPCCLLAIFAAGAIPSVILLTCRCVLNELKVFQAIAVYFQFGALAWNQASLRIN